VTAFLVRHAKAGSREKWVGSDEKRPLSKSGLLQAHGLVEQLRGASLTRILSSPYLRCVQTVEPLAAARGLDVEIEAKLAEGADPALALALLRRDGGEVFCSHADVIAGVMLALADRGVPLTGELTWAKGSTWALEVSGGRFVSGRYLPPPA
jgi:8-oxo-dGTP diphosphatase